MDTNLYYFRNNSGEVVKHHFNTAQEAFDHACRINRNNRYDFWSVWDWRGDRVYGLAINQLINQ